MNDNSPEPKKVLHIQTHDDLEFRNCQYCEASLDGMPLVVIHDPDIDFSAHLPGFVNNWEDYNASPWRCNKPEKKEEPEIELVSWREEFSEDDLNAELSKLGLRPGLEDNSLWQAEVWSDGDIQFFTSVEKYNETDLGILWNTFHPQFMEVYETQDEDYMVICDATKGVIIVEMSWYEHKLDPRHHQLKIKLTESGKIVKESDNEAG